jgi:dipeptidyl aminopeptidase/acylaminoacyl peptidase
MMHVRGLALVFATGALLAAGAAAARPFTPQDMATMERVSDPRVSPDGAYVIYDLRTVDYPNNKTGHELWIADLRSKQAAPRKLAASTGGAGAARWSPDGKAIYFTSSRSGSSQVWRTDVSGAAATQATSLPLDVAAFKLSPDGRTIVVAASVFPDCPTLECTKQRLAERAAGKTTGQVFDRLFVRHWDEWANGTNNHLFALDLDAAGVATGAPRPLMKGFDGDAPTKPFGGDEDFAFSPDGSAVLFSARLAGKTEPWSTNFDIWRTPVDGSAAPQNLTPGNPAWDTAPAFSPDGKWMAWRAMTRPGFEADRYRIMVRNLATGEEREVAPKWDRSPESLVWSADGRTLYANAEDVGNAKLFAIDVATGAVKPLTGPGRVTAFDAAKGSIVVAREQMDHPTDLFRVAAKGGAPEQITRHNADKLAALEFGAYEQFSFAGWNGEKVYGWVVKPVGFDPARTYPVAFLIHGGPQGSFGNQFHYRWNAQAYAGRGYAVVMIDFHGSTGYGQGFTDAISGHWGDRPLEDLQKGWAHALQAYPFLDGGRACALGGSYGGFMVNWIAGNWKEPWRCLVNHDGIFDTRMMGYSTEELWFSEWENGGKTPWEDPAAYERFNPVNHVAAWTKPMLVVQGGKDFRIPMEQGLATFTALQRKGVESRFLYYPDENHWVLRPQNSVQWHDEVLGWLDSHTR